MGKKKQTLGQLKVALQKLPEATLALSFDGTLTEQVIPIVYRGKLVVEAVNTWMEGVVSDSGYNINEQGDFASCELKGEPLDTLEALRAWLNELDRDTLIQEGRLVFHHPVEDRSTRIHFEVNGEQIVFVAPEGVLREIIESRRVRSLGISSTSSRGRPRNR